MRTLRARIAAMLLALVLGGGALPAAALATNQAATEGQAVDERTDMGKASEEREARESEETSDAQDPQEDVATASAPWWRLAGIDRYATMERISEAAFTDSRWAVLASGSSFPDALAASALAGLRKAPLLLTSGARLSEEARAELTRLGVKEAYVVGGCASVSDAVTDDLTAMGVSWQRVAGDNRQGTSVAIMREIVSQGAEPAMVVVATGASYADALSASPWAWAHAIPILLTQDNGTLGNPAVDVVWETPSVRSVVLVGGAQSVSDVVGEQLTQGDRSYTIGRLGGEDRYETSRIIAEWEVGGGLSWAHPCVASGRNFPDALAGASLAGSLGSPLLLANSADDTTMRALREHEDDFEGGYVLGGGASIAWEVCVPHMVGGNSELVSYVNLSPNHSGERLYPISRITPHYMSFPGSVEECGELFARYSREASSNYGIGTDGRVGLYCEECNRSWCSSSFDNDNRAITIECASLEDGSLTPATWESLVALCTDICQRNGIERCVYTGDETGTFTMHKWFAVNPPTDCPGPWLSNQFERLADEVNERLDA